MNRLTGMIRRNQQGTSLLEQMVALALGAVVLGSVATVWQQSQRAYLDGAEAADVQQDLRIALERITRAVQVAGANPTNQIYGGVVPNDPAFAAFRDAGPRCLRVYADLDGDGRVAGPEENISFRVADGLPGPLTEQRGGGPDTGQPWVTPGAAADVLAGTLIANPGNTAVFQFFTGPNDATPNAPLPAGGPTGCGMLEADRSRIARVVVTLTGRGATGSGSFTRTVVTEARARNVP